MMTPKTESRMMPTKTESRMTPPKTESPIGHEVKVTMDRPLGSRHPDYPDLVYEVNYGFVEGVPAADGEWQDAYVLGVSEALEGFTGQVIAVVHRRDDAETKWVVSAPGAKFSSEEIMRQIHFQEKYFDSWVEM